MRAAHIFVLSGLVLALIQFLSARSIWLDEAMLALNVLHRSPAELLQTLDYYQVAPPLWLLLVKLFSLIWPGSEQGFRLISLLAYAISLLLFYRLLRSFKLREPVILYTLGLFVFNMYMLYFATEVKQYMTDTAVSLMMSAAVLGVYSRSAVKYATIALLGALALLLSNAAPMILSGAAAFLLVQNLRSKKADWAWLTACGGCWMAVFTIYYLLFISGHPSKVFMSDYWLARKAFMPMDSSLPEFLLYKGRMMFDSLLPINALIKYLNPLFFVVGILALLRRNIALLALFFVPLAAHLLLSSLKLYPFELRLTLYMAPALMIGIAFGLDALLSRIRAPETKRAEYISAAILLCFFGGSFLLQHPFPLKRREIKHTIKYVMSEHDQNDHFYVSYYSKYPFIFYQDIGYCSLDSAQVLYESQPNSTFSDGFFTIDSAAFAADVARTEGRVWYFFCAIAGDSIKRNYMLDELERQGRLPLDHYRSKGSDAILLDAPLLPLSDSGL